MKATIQEITTVLDTKIRPSLQRHGGDLSVIDLNEGILKIELTGNCSNCPSVHFTIEEIIKAALNGFVEEVHVVNTMDEDLLNLAKSILKKN